MSVAKHALRLAAAAAALAAALAAAPMAASAQVCDVPNCVRDAEIETILREYASPIWVAAGLNPKDVEITLVQDPTLNAFAGNGEHLHFNTGLIMQTDTPEQLKGVMAHETGHLALGHSTTSLSAMDAAGGVSLISLGLGILAAAAGHPDAGIALMASGSEFAALTYFKYSRVQESAADAAALDYMEKTQQSPMGLIEFFERFRYEELMSMNSRDPYFVDHPISTDRIQAIRARALEIAAKAKPQSQHDIDNLAIMKAKLIGYLGPATRVYSKYPKTDMSEPAQYARAFAAYRATDIKNALTETQKLIDDHPDNPYYYELKGQILFESAKIEESIIPHRKSVELAPKQPLLKINLARSLIESKNPDNLKEAENLLNDSITQEKDDPFAWNQLANAYGKEGKTANADLATAEEAYYIGDMRRAQVFAVRASRGLDAATPEGRRALDIAAITDPKVLGRRGQGRGG